MSSASAIERLHPAVAHHIVNTLGWTSLRPLQARAVEPVLAGEHALLIAPTAGGKTEAAMFPVLSRMLTEDWHGLTVLYVTPLRALLNNLHERLAHYGRLLGRSVALWHGDTPPVERDRILAEPPDVLLTTPESIESMLISRRVDHDRFFRNVRVAVVDEIHAFAGDDRGWHLLAVLERVQRLSVHEIQRIGLSATVGNPGELIGWLTTTSPGPSVVVAPLPDTTVEPEVTVDYVGSIANAATVISRLHRGEKRLVFVDSRARAEKLAVELRARDVETYVSHGSLGREQRRQTEAAFAQARDCVIVATSTLELGIDVGDLDRVIQIDAPWTVSSFLQRLGRTGRRPGSSRNCLFLATDRDAFLTTLGLVRLWSQGYVEPVRPPAVPYHLLAQQLMALAIQEGGVGRHTWRRWLGEPFLFGEEVAAAEDQIVIWMIEHGLLHDDQGILGIGSVGEEEYGRRHFSELMSVFTSPPMFSVRHGRNEIGQIPLEMLEIAGDDPRVFLLGGRAWAVAHVEWNRHIVEVVPTDQPGRARWYGTGRPLSYEHSQAIREVLCGEPVGADTTKRADESLEALRGEFSWLPDDGTVVVTDERGKTRWWTFAGLLANAWLAQALKPLRDQVLQRDNLAVNLAAGTTVDQVRHQLAQTDWETVQLDGLVDREALTGLKFEACLPSSIVDQMVGCRLDAREKSAQMARTRVTRREIAV